MKCLEFFPYNPRRETHMMNLRWRSLWVAAAACVLAAAAASAKTKMVAAQGDEKPQEPPPRKILVLAIASDPITRATFEDVIAGELSLRGATAVASHLTFPELPKERAPFEAKLVADGFDAVTVTRLVGSDQKIKVQEGHTSYSTEYQGMDMWGGYWYTYEKVTVPGYLKTEKRARARTDLWRTSGTGGRLAWSGTSETLDPRTAAQAAREVGAAVAQALAKAKLI
jgi:hypothetical protein